MATIQELQKETKDQVVLYAEDEKTLKSIMIASLSKLFKDVIVASDGEEAFEKFLENRERIDLVITDLSMPKVDGIELTTKIKEYIKINALHTPPIVITTSHSEEEYLIKLIELNIDKFLSKPVTKEKIIDSLYSVCRSINDRKMVEKYREELETALFLAEKKNRILEVKLNQIAQEKNRQRDQKLEEASNEKEIIEEEEDYFDSLRAVDLDEIAELSIEIDSYITMTFQSENLREEYIEKFANAYISYGKCLGNYPVLLDLGNSLTNFGNTIKRKKENFEKYQKDLSLLLESLHFTLESFRDNVLKQRSEKPDFYNASLMSDLAFIENILEEHADGSGIELF